MAPDGRSSGGNIFPASTRAERSARGSCSPRLASTDMTGGSGSWPAGSAMRASASSTRGLWQSPEAVAQAVGDEDAGWLGLEPA